MCYGWARNLAGCGEQPKSQVCAHGVSESQLALSYQAFWHGFTVQQYWLWRQEECKSEGFMNSFFVLQRVIKVRQFVAVKFPHVEADTVYFINL